MRRSVAPGVWSVWSGRRASARAASCVRPADAGQPPRRRGVHRLLRIPYQRHPVPCGGAIAAAGVRGRRSRRATPARARVRAQHPRRRPRGSAAAGRPARNRRPRRRRCPRSTADARRRRLAALVNAAALARTEPALYVIEDVHWIDEVSESMLAEFSGGVPQTHSTGADHVPPRIPGRAGAGCPGCRRSRCAPLSTAQTAALTAELLGTDSVGAAPGEPDRRTGRREPVLRRGDRARPGRTRRARRRARRLPARRDVPPTSVCRPHCRPPSPPASTVSVTPAKRTLYAAAVIGARFRPELLAALLGDSRIGGYRRAGAGGADRSGGVHSARASMRFGIR